MPVEIDLLPSRGDQLVGPHEGEYQQPHGVKGGGICLDGVGAHRP